MLKQRKGSKGSRLVHLDLPVHQLVHVRHQLRHTKRNVSALCGMQAHCKRKQAQSTQLRTRVPSTSMRTNEGREVARSGE
jgi:hypothetical protein